MKIGINTSFIDLKSGIGTYIYNLVRELQSIRSMGDEFNFFLSRKSYTQGIFDEENNNIYRYGIPRYNSLRKAFWEQITLPGKIKRIKLDLFHSPAFISPLGLDVPSVVTVHDLAYLKYPETILKHKRRYYDFMFRRSVENAAKVITPSEFVKNEVIKHYNCPPDKVTAIHEGVADLFSPESNKDAEKKLLKRFGIVRQFLLFVGIIEPRKNLKRILRAYQNAENTKDVQFVIAGKAGWMYEDISGIIEQLKKEGRIIITGEISPDELKILYNSCIALIFTTLYEGFGLPILEAMACGAPVVISNYSAMPEVAGEAALKVDAESVDDIMESIDRIIEDDELRNELKRRGKDNIRRFSWRKCAEETYSIYRSV